MRALPLRCSSEDIAAEVFPARALPLRCFPARAFAAEVLKPAPAPNALATGISPKTARAFLEW